MSDIFDDLDNPQVREGVYDYFAQIKLDTWYCILAKGVGKQPFDAATHKADQRRTAIDINLYPLAEQNISFDISRSMISESREWAGIVLPSIKNLGISARDLNGKWAHVRTKGTGNTYTAKDGSTKERTTFEFVELFADEASCRAAFNGATSGAPAPVSAPAPVANGSDPGKVAAMKFLPVIVKNAVSGQTDLNVIRSTVATNLASMPQIGKYFTVDSPEVMDQIMGAMIK
jgi:hypothetical protein